MITEEQLSKWRPIGFKRDPLASRGWGSLAETGGESITFEELVARYNALLTESERLRAELDNLHTEIRAHAEERDLLE